MDNQKFRERFDAIVESKESNKNKLLDELIEEMSNDLVKQTILDKNDFYELSKKDIYEKLQNIIYKCENGTMLMVNHRIDSYCYNNGWIDLGFLYNVLKGAMRNNLNNLSNSTDYYRNLKYQIDYSEIDSIILLK